MRVFLFLFFVVISPSRVLLLCPFASFPFKGVFLLLDPLRGPSAGATLSSSGLLPSGDPTAAVPDEQGAPKGLPGEGLPGEGPPGEEPPGEESSREMGESWGPSGEGPPGERPPIERGASMGTSWKGSSVAPVASGSVSGAPIWGEGTWTPWGPPSTASFEFP